MKVRIICLRRIRSCRQGEPKKSIENEIRYFPTQPLANCEIGPKMDPCKDSAQGRLLLRVRNSGEGTLHARQDFRRDRKIETISDKEGNQYGSPAGADNGVRSGVGRVRRGVDYLWKPIGVCCSIRIVVGCRRTYCSDGPPEIIDVFGVVESDHVVGQRQVEHGKEPCTLRRRQVMREGRRLADFVPIVLNRPIPKASGERLIRCACRSVFDSKRFHFVKCIAIRITG